MPCSRSFPSSALLARSGRLCRRCTRRHQLTCLTRAPSRTAAEATRPRDSGAVVGPFSLVRDNAGGTAMASEEKHYLSNGAETATAPAGGARVRAHDAGEDGRPEVHRPARVVAAHVAAALGVRRERLRGGPRLRRLVDPRLAGHLRERHAADAAGRHGDSRPVHARRRRSRSSARSSTRSRASRTTRTRGGSRAAPRSTCARPASPTRPTSAPRASSSSSTRSPTTCR